MSILTNAHRLPVVESNAKHRRLAPCRSRERRTALISAAVTGKIDVRGLAETVAP